MINKTSELILSLSNSETKAIDRYLKSPLFNCNDQINQLFQWIIKSKSENINLQKAATFLSLTNLVTIPRLRYLLTDLNKNLEIFFALRKLMSDKAIYNTVLLEALSVKNCDKSFNAVYRSQTLNRQTANANSWLQKFTAEEIRYIYYSTRQKRSISLHYDKLFLSLEAFYTAKKLQLQCEILNSKTLITGNMHLLQGDEVYRLAQTDHLKDIPAVKIYYLISLMLSEPDQEKHFTEGLKFINKYKKLFPVEEEKDLYQYIKNYCVKKINEGHISYTRKLFEIYKSILDNKRLMNHDYFPQWEFKNLVTISLRLNESEWCRKFIDSYISYLSPPERLNAYNYNLAYLCWFEKKYNLSLKLLQKVEFTDVVYQLDSRAVILKIYYETSEEESLYYHLSAFKAFLRRNTAISESLRIQYSNLIRYTAKLARHGWNKRKRLEIKNELKQDIRIADKTWLEKQLDLLNSEKK